VAEPVENDTSAADDDPAGFSRQLRQAVEDRGQAASQLLPMVYDRLRMLAQAKIGKLPVGQTLQATALVHEAWLNLVGDEDPGWDCQAHFLGAAAVAMRDIIVDNVRRKSRLKRGGDMNRAELDVDQIIVTAVPVDDVLAMNQALEALEQTDAQKGRIVTLKCFGGLTMPEIAKVVGVSLATVEREWRFSKAWIQRHVEGR
jgi:RNA polymerase sigma factor (TIGR02999 family)